MIEITMRYFSVLKQQRRIDREILSIEPCSVAELYNLLAERYDFSVPLQLVRAAVNGEYVDNEYRLAGNEEVAFIPPVSGG